MGRVYVRSFVDLAGLEPDQAVLEPGCGTGRMAEALCDYLSSEGSYDGFDVVSAAIDWCEKNIASGHPNFHFRHVDVFNRGYNPKGRLDPREFAFPYADEAFDFVFLTSVFTHMLPADVRHYLTEIRRVLRPGGRCVVTYFILNDETRAAAREGRAARGFEHQGDGYFYDVAERAEAAVAYREEDVLSSLEDAGLRPLAPIYYGRWSGRTDSKVGQDVVVAERGD